MGSEYIIKYVADMTDAVSGAKRVESINKDIAQTISTDFKKAVRVVGTSVDKLSEKPIKIDGQQATQQVKTLGTVIQTADGRFQEFTKTQTFVNGKLKNTQGSLKDVSGQFARTSVETAKAKKNFIGLGENLKRLAKRAALTIPIWLALRATMQAVSQVLRDGGKALIDQDRALQKARRNLTGTSEDMKRNFNTLKKTTQDFSLVTGESVGNIITAFQRFATTGLDFETSMRGALASTKTAVLLFGETEQVANSVARAFRVLGGRTDEYATKGEELESFLALISELWKTNAFEINEFASAIERIAPTAKSANLSLNETAILLSAIQTAGIRGSRAGRLLSSSILQMEKNFDKFEKTLGVNLRTVDSTFKRLQLVTGAIEELNRVDPVKASQAVTQLFRIRGGQVVKALTAMNVEIKKMTNTKGDLIKFNQEFENVNQQVFRQVERFKNLRTEIGKTFLVGVTGAEDFAGALKEINTSMEKTRSRSQATGEILKNAFTFGGIFKTLDLAIEEQSKLLPKKLQKLFKISTKAVVSPGQALFDLGELFDAEGEIDLDNFTQQTEKQIKDAVERGFKNAEIAKISVAPEDQFRIAEAILESELDRLKVQGALSSELLKAEDILRKQLSIEEKGLQAVEQRLSLEKAIREEKRLQSRLGSESIKLFDIAKTSGVDVAKKLGDVLAGEIDFGQFVRRGGKALEVFQQEFADIFKQQQALSFFRGETVAGGGLRGGGTINISEESIRKMGLSGARTARAETAATGIFARTQQITAKVDAPINITADIDISKLDEVKDTFVSEVAKQLPRAGSEVNLALTKALTGKQNRVL